MTSFIFCLKWKWLFVLVLIVTPFTRLEAQCNGVFTEVIGGYGKLTPHNTEIQNLACDFNIQHFRAGLILSDSNCWHSAYHYPEVGIGFSRIQLQHEALGDPHSVYAFMRIPFGENQRAKFSLEISFGYAWGFKPYSETNQENLAIGSIRTAYASLGPTLFVPIMPRLKLRLFAGGYHYSNGSTMQPNKGINLLGGELGIQYMIFDAISKDEPTNLLPTEHYSGIMVVGGVSRTQENYGNPHYNCWSLSTGYYHSLGIKSRISAGVDLFWDYGNGDFYKVTKGSDVFTVGFFGGHEFLFGKLALGTQLGFYIYNPNEQDPKSYVRIFLRYPITKAIVFSSGFKTHEFNIDFLELGFGVRLPEQWFRRE